VFALDGVNWRVWSAADRVSATYALLLRTLDGDGLRALHTLMGDKAAVAALDREKMGQTEQLQLDNPPGKG
jgi:hypothetical protein